MNRAQAERPAIVLLIDQVIRKLSPVRTYSRICRQQSNNLMELEMAGDDGDFLWYEEQEAAERSLAKSSAGSLKGLT